MTELAAASASARGGPRVRLRLESVDILRGIVMIIMALDHVRDFFGNYAVNPTDPATTTAGLFFTRWITHFCAPTFFLLTGLGSRLSLRNKSTGELSRFLVTRACGWYSWTRSWSDAWGCSSTSTIASPS